MLEIWKGNFIELYYFLKGNILVSKSCFLNNFIKIVKFVESFFYNMLKGEVVWYECLFLVFVMWVCYLCVMDCCIDVIFCFSSCIVSIFSYFICIGYMYYKIFILFLFDEGNFKIYL